MLYLETYGMTMGIAAAVIGSILLAYWSICRMRRHLYVDWDHCNACYRTWEATEVPAWYKDMSTVQQEDISLWDREMAAHRSGDVLLAWYLRQEWVSLLSDRLQRSLRQ
jgi:hypothetical protein